MYITKDGDCETVFKISVNEAVYNKWSEMLWNMNISICSLSY